MDEPGWLTLAEIARRLGHPLSTIGSRRDAYREYLDERRGERDRALYRVEAFRELDRLMAQRASRAEIRRSLEAIREGGEPPPSRDDAILAELRAIRAAVERIAAWLVESKPS